MSKYITNRLTIEAFEYDPYGEKPEWFINMIIIGKAFEYKKHGYGEIKNGLEWRRFETGDKVYIDENEEIGIIKASLFSKFCNPIDDSREASAMFKEKINEAIYNQMNNDNN